MLGAMFKKIGMTRVFDKEGASHPVVVLKLDSNRIVGSRLKQRDGYTAVMVGYGNKPKEKRKVVKGFYKELSVSRGMREFCVQDEVLKEKRGAEISVGSFANVSHVDARGVSIGKGFQGVIKRHGMGGGPKTHGSHFHRRPGSIGNCADPARVFKGRKMPGQMGNQAVCVQNLRVMGVDEGEGLLWVRGSVPGARGALVELRPSLKKQQTMQYVFVDDRKSDSGDTKPTDDKQVTGVAEAEKQTDVAGAQVDQSAQSADAPTKASEGGAEKSVDQSSSNNSNNSDGSKEGSSS